MPDSKKSSLPSVLNEALRSVAYFSGLDDAVLAAEAHGHRRQVPLHLFLHARRFLALLGEQDRLQPRVLDRRGPAQRDKIEQGGQCDDHDQKRQAGGSEMPPVQRDRADTGGSAAHEDDVQLHNPPTRGRNSPAAAHMARPGRLTPLARIVDADAQLASWNDRRLREEALLRAAPKMRDLVIEGYTVKSRWVAAGGDLYVDGGTFRLKLPAEKMQTAKAYAGKSVVFGARPEDFHDREFVPPGIRAESMTADVDVTELMGNEIINQCLQAWGWVVNQNARGGVQPFIGIRIGKEKTFAETFF